MNYDKVKNWKCIELLQHFKAIFLIIFFKKNSSAKYYQDNKGRLKKTACERYQSLSKKEKEKKQQCGCERYKNLS